VSDRIFTVEEIFPADRLQAMFDAQQKLQAMYNGYDLDNQTQDDRIENIKLNVLALTDELHEALNETGWKPWATSRHINEDALKNELIDAWHFFMNLCLHAGLTPDELFKRYAEKRAINVQRQIDGYDGVSTKCGGCARALDDPAVACSKTETPSGFICMNDYKFHPA
jgi:dimeric dUTPase (all-alpha-NTP-PPase superfamily)